MTLIVSAKFRRRSEQGFIITLVAVFMLFVVGAMAALSIDVVTFYTARSEAQLAADSAALAGARVLANSGMTSDVNALTDGMWSQTQTLCQNVGSQVGGSNQVGGQTLVSQISVVCSYVQPGDPTAKAQVSVNVPTFFARIWGTTQVTVVATATAEAYNPSGLTTSVSNSTAIPVALSCVKPWLLPNLDPALWHSNLPSHPGAINDTGLLGQTETSGMVVNCPPGGCTLPLQSPTKWMYYPGDTSSSGEFEAPPSSSLGCSPPTSGFTPTAYQLSIAGCVQAPISCNATGVHVDIDAYAGRDTDTFAAVNCLSHSASSTGDTLDLSTFTAGPFEFLTGTGNPLVAAGVLSANKDVLVSDALVTVPVFDTNSVSGNTVNLIGFLQLFLNPDGNAAPNATGHISTTVINMVGCGSSSTGNPVYGNGATAVSVRLITPQ